MIWCSTVVHYSTLRVYGRIWPRSGAYAITIPNYSPVAYPEFFDGVRSVKWRSQKFVLDEEGKLEEIEARDREAEGVDGQWGWGVPPAD